MKHKTKILLTSLMLLNITSNNNYVINNDVKLNGNRQTDEAFKVIANHYYKKGKYIQYDMLKLDKEGDKLINRRQVNIKPEDINKNNIVYMDCSSFIYNVYKEALDVDPLSLLLIDGANENNFNTKNLANLRTKKVNGYYSNALIYGYDYKTRTFYENGEKKSTKKINYKNDNNSIKKELKKLLNPGDIIVLRKKGSGHVMLYVEDNNQGYFVHATGSSYDYEKREDNVEGKGAIKKEKIEEVLDNTSNNHYLFNDEYNSLTILRPLNVFGSKLSSNTINRLINQNLTINKTANIDESKTIEPGSKITYTISIKNNAKETQKILFEDILPLNTELVSGNLNEDFTLAHNRTKTITYTIKVLNENIDIVNDDSKINGQLLNTITHKTGNSLSKLEEIRLIQTAEKFNNTNVGYNKSKEFNKITAKISNAKLNYNPARFISSIYYNAFNININLESSTQIENDVFDNINGTLYLKSNIQNMVVPNLYGGTNVSNNDPKRTRKILKNDLMIGDIISYRYIDKKETGNTYLYLGDNKLLGIGTKKIINVNVDKILNKLLGCKSFVILRPSLVHDLNIKEIENIANFDEAQKEVFNNAVNRYLTRIKNNTIKYNSEKRDLGVKPQNCSYLDSSSLIYNIYNDAFNIQIPSTSTSLLNTKNEKLRVQNVDNIKNLYMHNLTMGDIIVYKYSTNEGMKGIVSLYLDDDKILKYNNNGYQILSLGEYKKEALDRIITDLKIIRPSQGYKLNPQVIDFIDTEKINMPKTITVEIGEKKKLEYEILPENSSNKDITIKSSNNNIKINNGYIEGVKAGESILTLKTKDNTGIKTSTEVKVIKKREIKFNYNSYQLLKGHYILITPNTTGEIKTVSSSNNNIAKAYLEGKKIKVIGLKAGEADIKVTLKNGNTATTKIKIAKNDENKDISFQNDNYKIAVDEERVLTLTFKENVEIDRFEVSNQNIVNINKTSSNRSVIVKGLKPGKVTLKVLTNSGVYETTTINVVEKIAFERRRNINLYTSTRKKIILNRDVKDIYVNDNKIVKINNGLITGLKKGKTTIKVVTKDNQIIKYIINVKDKFFNRK